MNAKFIGREVQLKKKLGSGTFGEVYLAECVRRERRCSVMFPEGEPFVVKVLMRTEMDREEVEAAYREFSALQKLHHRFIVRYIGAWMEVGKGRFAGRLCLAMNYCNGGDLLSYLDKCVTSKQPPSATVLVRLIVCVFSALNYSHHRHVIHRDIKPENVLMTKCPSGTLKYVQVGDFGLARHVDQMSELVASRVGTPSYCSPEIGAGKLYTHKTDIFSAGVMFYELMTLERPFWVKNSLAETFRRVAKHDPVPRLRELSQHHHYSNSLVQLVAACLSKRERDRPSAFQVLSAFSTAVWREVSVMRIDLHRDGESDNECDCVFTKESDEV